MYSEENLNLITVKNILVLCIVVLKARFEMKIYEIFISPTPPTLFRLKLTMRS